jgi:PAS domain S-box-containing protein
VNIVTIRSLPDPVEAGLYSEVIEGVPAMLWLGDAQGHCVFLNRAQRDFWGVKNRDLSDFNWLGTLHPDDTDALFGPYAAAMKAHQDLDVEARYRRADGEWRVLRTTARPRFGDDGRFLGMIGVNVDVTEQRRAEEELRRSSEHLRLALDASGGVGTWVWEVPEDKVHADANFASIFGVEPEMAASGTSVTTFLNGIQDQDREAVALAIEAVLSVGGPFDCEFRVAGHPERWFAALGHCETDADGRPTVFSGIVIDITDRRGREEQLSLLTQELTHRIKNIFTVISAMTSFAARSEPAASDRFDELKRRFQAMSAAYTLVISKPGEADETNLAALVVPLFAPYGGRDQILCEIPDLPLGPKAASSVALILHELATNAAKYGALMSDGTVRVGVTSDGDAVHFVWEESGGPQIDGAPVTTGFGFRLIGACCAAIGAAQTTDWATEGLRWSMRTTKAQMRN